MANNKDTLLKMVKSMEPGAVMQFVSKQLDQNPAEFLLKNAGWLAVYAVKNGWAKGTAIKDAVKDFSAKSKADMTEIDWKNVQIDEDTILLACLFDGDSGKKLKEFAKELYDKMVEFTKEEEKSKTDVKESMLSEATSVKRVALPMDTVRKLTDWYDQNAEKMFPEIGKLAKQADELEKKLHSSFDEFSIDSSSADMNKLADKYYEVLDKLNSLKSAKRIFLSAQEVSQTVNGHTVKYVTTSGNDTFWKLVEYARQHKEVAGDIDNIQEKYVKSTIDAADALEDAAKSKAKAIVDKAVKNSGKAKAAGAVMTSAKEATDAATDGAQVVKAAANASNAKQLLAAFKDYKPKSREETLYIAARLSKMGKDQKEVSTAVHELCRRASWFHELEDDDADELLDDIDDAAANPSSVLQDYARQKADQQIANAADAAKTPKEAVEAAGGSKDAAKELADDKEAKEEVAKKAGIKGFTALGWARLAAKTTGYILNNGKTVVDALGARKVKKEEDKNIIAEIVFTLDNGEDADSGYSDTQFSVRFDVNDLKWHATCLDDRKMKFPEDDLVKKALATDTAKKFKQFCLKKWKSLFNAKQDSEYAMLPFMLKNIDQFGFSRSEQQLVDRVKAVADNLDKIQKAFR